MGRQIADFRREYGLAELRKSDLDPNPVIQFQRWFSQASGTAGGMRWRRLGIALYKGWQAILGRESIEANAMALATADAQGRPSVRMVLLKGVDQRGFIFYTNYDSRKGAELAANARAALAIYWSDLERQVCVRGPISKLPAEESAAYFKSRPRGSQLAAWASKQSQVLADREELQARLLEMEERFATQSPLPLPPNWGGYILAPEEIEFWQGGANRMHDRLVYHKTEAGWTIERLSP